MVILFLRLSYVKGQATDITHEWQQPRLYIGVRDEMAEVNILQAVSAYCLMTMPCPIL